MKPGAGSKHPNKGKWEKETEPNWRMNPKWSNETMKQDSELNKRDLDRIDRQKESVTVEKNGFFILSL